MIEKLWKDGKLIKNDENVGKYAVMDPTRRLCETRWGADYRSNDTIPTLRKNNELYILALGQGKACHVRDLKVPERAALQGVMPATLKGFADTDIKRWLGNAYPTPMCAVVMFRLVHAMSLAMNGPLQRGPITSWPPLYETFPLEDTIEPSSVIDEDASVFDIAEDFNDKPKNKADAKAIIEDFYDVPRVGVRVVSVPSASKSSSVSRQPSVTNFLTTVGKKRKAVIDLGTDSEPDTDSDISLLNIKKSTLLKTTEGDSQDSCQESPHRAIPKKFFNAGALETEEAAKENDMKVVGNSKNAEAVKIEEAAKDSDSSESTSTEGDSQDTVSAIVDYEEDSPQPFGKFG